MSFGFGTRTPPSGYTLAGGEASLVDIFSAGIDQMTYVDSTVAAGAAYAEAYDRRIREVFEATGVKLRNPYLVDHMEGIVMSPRGGGSEPIERKRQYFADKVAEAARRIPDQAVADRLNRSIDGDAINIAREADERLGRNLASRPTWAATAASIGGALVGGMRDPVQVGSLLIGGGPGAARTVAGRILGTAAREALINGATTAAMQPAVQDWRQKAGLDHGLQQALNNVAMAAAFGGVLGGAFQGIGEGAARITGRGVDTAADAALRAPGIRPEVKAAMTGDLPAAAAELGTIREALPPAARGALDAAEQLEHSEAVRPGSATPEVHERNISTAHQVVDAGETRRFTPDPAQVARLTEELAPTPAAPAGKAPQSLVEFLAARGGVLDDHGELAAIGAQDLAKRRKGGDRRVPLDSAREAAEQAGYIGQPGRPQATTVRDLLDAIDREKRGSKVFSRQDAPAIAEDVAGRAQAESLVHELVQLAGPGVDDAVIRDAAALVMREGADPADAIERAVMDTPDVARSGRSGEALPGWSDAELDRLSGPRGTEPAADPASPFDDPAKPLDDEFLVSAADLERFGNLELPGEESPTTLSAMLDSIERDKALSQAVTSCPI